ncbi:MAG: hypothetical protein KatS3mg076_0560 [Candidatus Binatia bacterium]|nr:MAG: hypothetical protein KatS3mg076_0560 [Candidatus Binatia bacterium]
MRCKVCAEEAGWFRRWCRSCSRLWEIYRQSGEILSPADLLSAFDASGASPRQIEAFLRFDPDGEGSIEDRLAARTANALLAALGRPERQTAQDVARLRRAGRWKAYDRKPPEGFL